MTLQDLLDARVISAAYLQHRAELFAEQRGRTRACTEIDVQATATRECHLRERREQAAVRAIVVRQDRAGGTQRADRVEETQESLRVVAVGRIVAEPAVDLREARAAEAI